MTSPGTLLDIAAYAVEMMTPGLSRGSVILLVFGGTILEIFQQVNIANSGCQLGVIKGMERGVLPSAGRRIRVCRS